MNDEIIVIFCKIVKFILKTYLYAILILIISLILMGLLFIVS